MYWVSVILINYMFMDYDPIFFFLTMFSLLTFLIFCRIREEKVKKTSEGGSKFLSWVNKSRKIEEHKSAEREKVARLAKIF